MRGKLTAMSRRTTASLRQPPRIPRFFGQLPVGARFASWIRVSVCAAIGCVLVGGCIVTSAEDFPDEPAVPPVVLNNTDLPLGSIVRVNKNEMNEVNELRLGITVRDDNIDDELEVRVKLSVLQEPPYEFGCAGTISPGLEAERPQYSVILTPSRLRERLCTKVEIAVSSEFARECPPIDDEDRSFFDRPLRKNDVARAQFWIWEMSGDPLSNPTEAQRLISSCETEIRSQTAPSQTMQ